MTLRRSRNRDDRGTAALEFALVALPFVTLVFGAVDFGWAVNNDVLVNNAAREGAREGSLNPNAAAVTAVVRSTLSYADDGDVTVTVTCRTAAGGTCSLSSAVPGDMVVVRVSAFHEWITPIGGLFSPGGTTLTKTAEMRIE
ncbi:MAG TPA: TadE/TadG family type IV pilus assembly protein [Nocardioides sp.]|nr:TadE/TadG family type IV pilus assembly protein [Nocardioides sp.]